MSWPPGFLAGRVRCPKWKDIKVIGLEGTVGLAIRLANDTSEVSYAAAKQLANGCLVATWKISHIPFMAAHLLLKKGWSVVDRLCESSRQ